MPASSRLKPAARGALTSVLRAHCWRGGSLRVG